MSKMQTIKIEVVLRVNTISLRTLWKSTKYDNENSAW